MCFACISPSIGKPALLTRTGLDWSPRYPSTIEALRSLPVKTAYLDGELCTLRADGVPAFSHLQAAMDEGRTDELIFIVFDLLYLNGKSTAAALFARPIVCKCLGACREALCRR